MGVCSWLYTLWLGWFCYKKVCYDGLGCFENKPPFHNANFEVPQSPEEIQAQFSLYTVNDKKNAFNLTSNVSDISDIGISGYNASDRTIFIVHGFTRSSRDDWIIKTKDTILSVEKANIVLVDWEKGADNLLDYNQAAANTRVVGALIAQLITSFKTSTGASFKNMYIIGHSLGAHVAGYAGERIDSLGRITGLDPAYLLFSKKKSAIRLDPSDAEYVDVIHTDARKLLFGLGIADRLGHADFYPNGGFDQPGCLSILGHGTCDHSRAYLYFVESIDSTCRFNAVPCRNWRRFKRGKCSCDTDCAFMGFSKNDVKFNGKFYLKTRKRKPFCKE